MINSAKGFAIVLLSVVALAGCVEQPQPRRVYQAPPPPPPRTDVYAYPTQGQSPEQMDRDRYDCHEWAVKQTNFDPSAPGTPPHDRVVVAAGPPAGTNTAIGAVAGAILGAIDQRASDYRRAVSACLEGRGYSVK
jgi:hypothetical protein